MGNQVIRKRYFDDGSEPETIYDDTPPPRTVGYTEQQQTGMIKRNNFVAPAEITATAKRGPAQVLPVQETAHTLNVPLAATQHIEMKTSAVDRSKGFLIANVPLFGAFALLMWLLSGVFALAPWFSLTALLIFWLSFVLAWLASYVYTLRVSAEGIAMYESKQKWNVIKEEQRRRWEHYNQLKDGE